MIRRSDGSRPFIGRESLLLISEIQAMREPT